MNRTILSLLVAGLFTSLAGAAVAQNVTAGDKPANAPSANAAPSDSQTKAPKANADSKQGDMTTGEQGAKPQKPGTSATPPRAKGADTAANTAARADYSAAKAKAKAAFDEAKAKCDAMEGDAMRTCMSDAKAARTQALAEAKSQWQSQKSGGGAGMKSSADDAKPEIRSDMDAVPEASKPDARSDPRGGRLEKSRDDSIDPDAEKFQNVSTARKGQEGPSADRPKMN